jgi:hypothetical protein
MKIKKKVKINKKKILIFIITYYASYRLKKTFDLIPFKKLRNYQIKVLISDDNSTDDTKEIAKKISVRNKKLIFFKNNKKRLNYGGNIKSCLNFAINNNYDYALMLHGDSQYHPRYVSSMIKKILKSKCAAVHGSRMMNKKNALKGNMPIYKFLGNFLLTKYFNFIYNKNFTDCHSGYWIYDLNYINKQIIKKLTNGISFDNQMRIYLIKNSLKINEIPIMTIYGNEKSSVHIIYALKFIFETISKRFF